MKTKKLRNILILIGVLVIFILLFAVSFLMGRVKMNPAGTIGNTAGNLNNDGLFCEYDGTVYFSNASDHNRLYAMNPDESNIRKLNDLHVQNILAGGSYLYYFQTGSSYSEKPGNTLSSKSFNRCDLNGKNATGLIRDVVVSAQLIDNYIYMLTTSKGGSTFSKVKIDRSETIELADYEINPACAENGVIYYNGTQRDHYLYALDTATDTTSEIWQGNLWYPILQGDYVYYMDISENYRLCRYSLSQNEVQVLTDDRVDCFNVGSGYIYYQKNGSAPQLICMRTDGTEAKVIAEGNFTNINMTSQYVYFQPYGNGNSLFHSFIGSDGYDVFIAN